MDHDNEKIKLANTVYEKWAAGFAEKDLDAILDIYAEDAILESPLVNALLNTDIGFIQGRDALKNFFQIILDKTPALKDRYKESFFTDGKTMIWEYPRITPAGQKTDMAEVMKLESGRIKTHRIYWGWVGVQQLQSDTYKA